MMEDSSNRLCKCRDTLCHDAQAFFRELGRPPEIRRGMAAVHMRTDVPALRMLQHLLNPELSGRNGENTTGKEMCTSDNNDILMQRGKQINGAFTQSGEVIIDFKTFHGR